jgi:very-short-patch-repair endonuclease
MPKGIYIRTDKIKASLSAARKKNWQDPNCKYNSEEFREKQYILHLGEKNHNYNKPVSEKRKEKQRITMKKIRADPNSIYNSIEWKNKISQQHSDPNSVYQSKEYRNKISKANTGKIHSEQGRLNHRNAVIGDKHPMWGKHHTKESKLKIGISSKNMWKNPSPQLKNTLKIMHDSQKTRRTKPELKISNILNNMGIYYETQKWIYPYVVDFFIPSHNLILEADGKYAHGDKRIYTPTDIIQGNITAKEKWDYDLKRDNFLREKGYIVLRFWEKEIMKEPELVKELIKVAIIKNY